MAVMPSPFLLVLSTVLCYHSLNGPHVGKRWQFQVFISLGLWQHSPFFLSLFLDLLTDLSVISLLNSSVTSTIADCHYSILPTTLLFQLLH